MTEQVTAALARVVGRLPGGGEVREGQAAMAVAVARAIESDRHLVVRAGTGTGKSLGYLVPAVCSGRRVVVATATKALQDQLAEKDLPGLAETIGRSFRFAVLKGRTNYLCRQRLAESVVAGTQGELADAVTPTSRGRSSRVEDRAEQVRRLLAWAEETATGDRAELEDEPDALVWSSLSVTAEECPGASRCPSGSRCFAEAARERAAEADIVVVNLHLLGAEVASGGAFFPDYDVLVVDEAHALEDVVTESLGTSVSPGRLRAVAALVRAALGAATPGGRGARAEQERAADDLLDSAGRFEDLLAARRELRLGKDTDPELDDWIGLVRGRLERLEGLIRTAEERGRERSAGEAGADVVARCGRALLAAGGLRQDLGAFAELGEDEVAWVESGARSSLVVAPIDVSVALAEHVFSSHPVVLTSATIPPGLAERLGAEPERTDLLDVGSPFAYEQHGLLYCAAHLPDPRRSERDAAVHDELAALIEAAGGRTLALFTSRAAMEKAAAALRSRVDWPILCQGDASKGALLADFAGDPGACLFATMGFWQGVDVAGSTLSCVVIDRIPFPRPDDPLVSARRERAGPAAFRVVDLPRAASLLAQGAGRLIRTAEDRGVVAVLDSRLATASYRWDLVRALPPMRRTKERAEAEAFLRQLRDEAAEAPGPKSGRAVEASRRDRRSGISSRAAR